jgi:hypothetical protein
LAPGPSTQVPGHTHSDVKITKNSGWLFLILKMTPFGEKAPCNLVKVDRRFRGA